MITNKRIKKEKTRTTILLFKAWFSSRTSLAHDNLVFLMSCTDLHQEECHQKELGEGIPMPVPVEQ